MATTNKVLIQTNAVAGNEILTFNRGSDGMLTFKESDLTAGKGGVFPAPDPLASQGSLTYDSAHDLVFAVNAGDGFMSVLRFVSPFFVLSAAALSPAVASNQLVDRATLERFRPIFLQPNLKLQSMMTTNGTFPVSVAVHGTLVYVLNSKGAGSIQGYRIQSDSSVAPIPSSSRSLGMTSPGMFTESPAHIRFSPDGSKLVITTKANATGSRFLVFTVDAQGLPSAAAVATPSNKAIPFGFAFTADGVIVATEVGNGADSGLSSYFLNANGSLTFKKFQASGGAACWVECVGQRCYVSNFSAGTITVHTCSAAGNFGAAGSVTTTGVGGGAADLSISSDGKFLYLQHVTEHVIKVYPINANGTLGALVQTVMHPGFMNMQGIVAT